ncbi:MAG: hypothetical protein Q8880_09275 [Bacteroidota bacterium]|nr:hypothetical protein [Bacteroidota bacterium]
MEIIAHRINTSEQLIKVPNNYGIEIDIRDFGNELILQHDPFKEGERLCEYLKHYNHGTIILNIKSEGIEFRVMDLLLKFNVVNYFFLDCSFPMIYKLSNNKNKNIALRYSEVEGIDTILNMRDKVNWVWVDCLSKLTITKCDFDLLKNYGFKLCLVSPDLYGRPIEQINIYKEYLIDQNIHFDAICCKEYNALSWVE